MASRKTYGIVIFLVALIAISAYAAYMLSTPREGAESGAIQGKTISITDGTGRNVTIKLPVERVISLNSGLTELLYALGCGNKIIGRDALSVFPPQVLDKTVVGSSSYDPNVELVLELQPDLVLADDMLFYNTEALNKITNAGIPVIMENTANVSRIKAVISNLGLILGSQERAGEIVNFIEYYEHLVADRIQSIPSSKKPLVYIEWYRSWQSFAKGSAGNKIIFDAGGINIAGEIDQPAPVLSPEFVVERNPDIILRMAPSEAKGNLTAFQAVREELLSRPELQAVKAVKEGKVYVYDPILFEGIRYPAGLLYWAKCFHPDVFADVDPEAVHAEILQRFLGVPLEGVYFYPPPSSKNTSSLTSGAAETTVKTINWKHAETPAKICMASFQPPLLSEAENFAVHLFER